jgi:hypothetical protein
LLLPTALPIAVSQLGWRERTERENSRRMVWLILFTFTLLVVIAILVFVAFFLPMLATIDSLSGPRK